MERRLEREWLDELAPDDPLALGSRRDLRRLNALMGNSGIAARALLSLTPRPGLPRVIELGAGDGDFLLQVARGVNGQCGKAMATLVDRQGSIGEETRFGFERIGWQIERVEADVRTWVTGLQPSGPAIVLANLFLHHFSGAELRELFAVLSARTIGLVAIEPRRSALALFCSRLVYFVGCNRITRHDAPVSVRAGFKDRELSAIWPERNGWSLEERGAGLFSHLFVARCRR
jgi:hypothetical protein